MYEPGEVTVWLEPEIDEDGFDERWLGMTPGEEIDFPICFLPHSCDEWIIGGPAEVKAMIGDLEQALAMMLTVAARPPSTPS